MFSASAAQLLTLFYASFLNAKVYKINLPNFFKRQSIWNGNVCNDLDCPNLKSPFVVYRSQSKLKEEREFCLIKSLKVLTKQVCSTEAHHVFMESVLPDFGIERNFAKLSWAAANPIHRTYFLRKNENVSFPMSLWIPFLDRKPFRI